MSNTYEVLRTGPDAQRECAVSYHYCSHPLIPSTSFDCWPPLCRVLPKTVEKCVSWDCCKDDVPDASPIPSLCAPFSLVVLLGSHQLPRFTPARRRLL